MLHSDDIFRWSAKQKWSQRFGLFCLMTGVEDGDIYRPNSKDNTDVFLIYMLFLFSTNSMKKNLDFKQMLLKQKEIVHLLRLHLGRREPYFLVLY